MDAPGTPPAKSNQRLSVLENREVLPPTSVAPGNWSHWKADAPLGTVKYWLQRLEWKEVCALHDSPLASDAVPSNVRNDPRTARLTSEIQTAADALEHQGWIASPAKRIAIGQFLTRLELPDGSLNVRRGRTLYGPAFDLLLKQIRIGRPAIEHLDEQVIRTGDLTLLPPRERSYQTFMKGWLDHGFEHGFDADRYTSQVHQHIHPHFLQNIHRQMREQALDPEAHRFHTQQTEDMQGRRSHTGITHQGSLPSGVVELTAPKVVASRPGGMREQLNRLLKADLTGFQEELVLSRLGFGSSLMKEIDDLLRSTASTFGATDEAIRLALAEQVAACATDGLIEPARLKAAHHGELVRFLEKISRRPSTAPSPLPDEEAVRRCRPKLHQALVDDARASMEQLPVVHSILERYGRAPLRRHMSIVRGHLLGSTATLVEALGCQPSRTQLVGKTYSASALAVGVLRGKGFRADPVLSSHGAPGVTEVELERARGALLNSAELQSSQYDELIGLTFGLDRQSLRSLDELAEEWVANAASHDLPLHVVDDGAELLLRIARRCPELAARLSGVEQTRFGARLLAKEDLPFAVVNVAESAVKLHLESVLIAWSVAAEIQTALQELSTAGLPPGKKVAIIGYGAVGSAVSKMLASVGYEVSVVDTRPGCLEQAKADRFPRALSDTPEAKELLATADVVVGATGTTALSDLSILKHGAALFSASSSTIEFATASPEVGLEHPRPGGKPAPLLFGERNLPLIGNRSRFGIIRLPGKDLLLGRCGNPVNLTGEMDPISPEFIQLTRALLALGSAQAVSTPAGTRGLIPLDPEGQRHVASEWMTIMREQKEQIPPMVMGLLEQGYRAALDELGASARPRARALGPSPVAASGKDAAATAVR